METETMNCTDNPIGVIAECIAHAQYEGFSDIEYETRDWEKIRAAKTPEEKSQAVAASTPATRRPVSRDFEVYAMFPQTWGSTALGHGGMGGASMTTAYTVVLECQHTQEFLVYFGGTWCYTVSRRSANIDAFVEDCRNHCLVSKRKSEKYN
jgi:hypothetical protein